MLCSLFIGGAIVSAEDYMENGQGTYDTLTLTVNQQGDRIERKNHSQEALTAFMDYGNELRKRKPCFFMHWK